MFSPLQVLFSDPHLTHNRRKLFSQVSMSTGVVRSLQLTSRLYHPFQYFKINIGQFIYVQAAHTRFILTQLFKRGTKGINITAEVQRQVRFAWREAYPHPVGFPAGCGAFVSFDTETDEGIAPQYRLFLAGFLHHLQQYKAVFALLLRGNAIEKILHTCSGWFCFVISQFCFLFRHFEISICKASGSLAFYI